MNHIVTDAQPSGLLEQPIELIVGESCAREAKIREALPNVRSDLLYCLYGQERPAHCYMMVDATLRTQVTGLFDLDVFFDRAQCLFNGEAADDYAEVAPWLADLTIIDPDQDDLSFHRDFFDKHWNQNTSVLILTDASFKDVRLHLRRFIKLRLVETGAWMYFRFWDPAVLADFLRAIDFDLLRLRRMMGTDDGIPLNYVMRRNNAAIRFSADWTQFRDVGVAPMFIRQNDFDGLCRARETARLERMANRIAADFPAELGHIPKGELDALVGQAVERFRAYGFNTHSHQHFFAVWSILYGLGFEQLDETRKLQSICAAVGPEKDRFREFRDRLHHMDISG